MFEEAEYSGDFTVSRLNGAISLDSVHSDALAAKFCRQDETPWIRNRLKPGNETLGGEVGKEPMILKSDRPLPRVG